MNNWKVEIRENCKICGGKLPNARFRTYCSPECRNKSNNKKQKESGYNTEWQRKKRKKDRACTDIRSSV